MGAKRITLPIMLVILFALLLSTNIPSTAGLEYPTVRVPEEDSVVTTFPTEVKYSNNTEIFADFADLWGRPTGVNYEEGRLLVTLRVYKPDNSEIPGDVNNAGLLPGEEPPNPYERVTLVWKRTGGGELPAGDYRVIVEWRATHTKIDEWSFTFQATAKGEYFQVFDADQLLDQFATLDAAKTWAKTKAYELKKTLVIKSSVTGEVVATVEYTPPPPGYQPPPLVMGPLASLFWMVRSKGSVAVIDAKGKPFAIRIGQDIPLGTYVATGKDSSATIKVGDNQVKLAENTSMLLLTGPLASLAQGKKPRVVYQAIGRGGQVSEKQLEYGLPKYSAQALQKDAGNPGIMLFEGKLTADVWKVDPAIGFRIYTPISMVEATGTKFEVTASSKGSSEVQVFDGEVNFTDLVKRKSVTVEAGETSQVTSTTTPTAPQKIAEERGGLLSLLPVWAWIIISAVTGVIITLLIVIVILLIVRRGPKTA